MRSVTLSVTRNAPKDLDNPSIDNMGARLSGALLTSIVVGRPLVSRFAHDFCSISPDIDARPAVVRLYRRLTFLWVIVNLTAAVITITLLLTVRTSLFVAVKPFTGAVLTVIGVAFTVSACVATARSEGLLTSISADGVLCARAQIAV